MISSPQPNNATSDSDSKGHKDSTTTTTEPFPLQLSTQEKPEQDLNRLQLLRAGDSITEQKPTRQKIDRPWWQRLSLRNKATALAIAIGTIPVLALGTINYFTSSRDIRENVIGLQKSLALSLGDQLGRFMFERYADVETLSGLRSFSDPSISAITPRQEKEKQLNRFLQVYKLYDNIAVFNLNGNVIAQSKGDASSNVKNENYFQTVLKTDRAFISQPTVSRATGINSIYITAPIKNSDTGATIAVMRTRMPVSYLDNILSEETERLSAGFQALSQDEYHLVDGNGKIFVAEEEELGRDARSKFSSFAQIQAAKQVAVRLSTDQNDNAKQLIAYAPIEQVEGTPDLNWSLLLTEPVDVAFAAQRGLLLTLIIGTGLTTLIVAAIAAYLANRATRPILAAAGAVNKLGQGELDTRIAVEGQDELSMLGSNINRMAGQMQILLQNQAAETERAGQTKDITLHISQSVNPETIFNTAVEEIRHALKTDRVVVYAFNEIWQGTVIAESVDEKWPRALGAKIDDPCFAKQYVERYRRGRVQPTENIHAAGLNDCYLKQLEAFAVQANLVAPILRGDQLLGLLIAHHCSEPRAWQQGDVDLFAQLATQIGFALDRANLLKQQTSAKEQLQRRALELLMEVDPISRGDLTIRASVTEDEIGTVADSYNATVESLRKIVTQVQLAAQQMATTTNSNTQSVQGLSTEALRQTEEITVAMDRIQEMSSSIRAVAKSAEQAGAAVQQANQTVEEGDTAMNRTVDGILAIQETVAETSTKVQRLGEASRKISGVVKLINAFADQTNLLALNAAIEAARAGEEGRGFAVIADEVQSLAQQSAQATAEIESLVTEIQTETSEVAAAMAAGTQQVVTGTKLVDETRQSLNKITAVSAQISELVQAIAYATVAQSQASESVTQTMTGVAAISNKTSNEAIEVSASFKDLLAVAQQLQASAAQFKVS